MLTAYSAAFETHNTLHYLHELLRTAAALPATMQPALPIGVVDSIKTVIHFSLGQLRFAYPDKLPGMVLQPLACPAGPGSCPRFNFSNDFSVAVPIEDYWGGSSHRGFSPFNQPTEPALDMIPTLGHIGQEIYGAGAAFDAALLSPIYGSTSGCAPPTVANTLQLYPRVTTPVKRGASTTVHVYPPMSAAQWGNNVTCELQSLGGSLTAQCHFDHDAGVGAIQISTSVCTPLGRNEVVIWIHGIADPGIVDTGSRPSRIVVMVVL